MLFLKKAVSVVLVNDERYLWFILETSLRRSLSFFKSLAILTSFMTFVFWYVLGELNIIMREKPLKLSQVYWNGSLINLCVQHAPGACGSEGELPTAVKQHCSVQVIS